MKSRRIGVIDKYSSLPELENAMEKVYKDMGEKGRIMIMVSGPDLARGRGITKILELGEVTHGDRLHTAALLNWLLADYFEEVICEL